MLRLTFFIRFYFNREHVAEIFGVYGSIRSVEMPADRVHTHLSRGYAYVEFENADDAEKAIKHMDGGTLFCNLFPNSNQFFVTSRPNRRTRNIY